MKNFGESLKDLKLLLEVDDANAAAKGEYVQVKQLWEKALRQLQTANQQARTKKTSHSSKKKSQGHKNKGGNKEEKTAEKRERQKKELEQLLAETKSKMKELKKEVRAPLGFAENSSEYLTASKTTYYDQPPQNVPQGSAGVRRRKVVIEEEGEGEEEEGGAPVREPDKEVEPEKSPAVVGVQLVSTI